MFERQQEQSVTLIEIRSILKYFSSDKVELNISQCLLQNVMRGFPVLLIVEPNFQYIVGRNSTLTFFGQFCSNDKFILLEFQTELSDVHFVHKSHGHLKEHLIRQYLQ